MKKIMILIGIVLMLGVLYSTKKVPLDLVGRPAYIEADDTQLYIAEGAFIHIYSLKDYSFQKKFGGRGEGPGEFRTMSNQNLGSVLLDIYPDYLIINSIGKISFFTKQGKMIKEIPTGFNGRFLPLKLTEKDKKKFKNSLKMRPVTRTFYELIKNRLKFPDFFPKIRLFNVVNQKIYVLSWRKKGNKSELYIYDLKGNPISKTYVSLVEEDIMLPYPYTIRNEKLYQVVENEDSEGWELHVSEIK